MSIWWNYRTEEHIEADTIDTDATARDFIPQDEVAQALYAEYRALGLPILKSVVNVLSLHIGEPERYPVDEREGE